MDYLSELMITGEGLDNWCNWEFDEDREPADRERPCAALSKLYKELFEANVRMAEVDPDYDHFIYVRLPILEVPYYGE